MLDCLGGGDGFWVFGLVLLLPLLDEVYLGAREGRMRPRSPTLGESTSAEQCLYKVSRFEEP